MTIENSADQMGNEDLSGRIEMCLCTVTLLREIADKTLHQKDVAKTYALAMKSSEITDWEKVNKAIMRRWSISGLERIKQMAWSGKCWK